MKPGQLLVCHAQSVDITSRYITAQDNLTLQFMKHTGVSVKFVALAIIVLMGLNTIALPGGMQILRDSPPAHFARPENTECRRLVAATRAEKAITVQLQA